MTLLESIKRGLTRCASSFYENLSLDEKKERHEWFCDELKDYQPDDILASFSSYCNDNFNKHFPKPEDIKSIINLKKAQENDSFPDYSWVAWLMKIPVNEAKYYGHKVFGNDKNKVLNRLRLGGIPDFEPIENASWFGLLKNCIAEISSGNLRREV